MVASRPDGGRWVGEAGPRRGPPRASGREPSPAMCPSRCDRTTASAASRRASSAVVQGSASTVVTGSRPPARYHPGVVPDKDAVGAVDVDLDAVRASRDADRERHRARVGGARGYVDERLPGPGGRIEEREIDALTGADREVRRHVKDVPGGDGDRADHWMEDERGDVDPRPRCSAGGFPRSVRWMTWMVARAGLEVRDRHGREVERDSKPCRRDHRSAPASRIRVTCRAARRRAGRHRWSR